MKTVTVKSIPNEVFLVTEETTLAYNLISAKGEIIGWKLVTECTEVDPKFFRERYSLNCKLAAETIEKLDKVIELLKNENDEQGN